jgi:AcrR family transcriptional regulator
MAKAITLQQRRASLSSKTEKRVKELLRTAREVFSQYGYEKATTLEIANRLGISEGTVFTYFGSKRELCLQVIRDWYEEISTELEQEVPLIQGVRAQLHYVVRKHLGHLLMEGKGLCALVLSEGRSVDLEFADVITDLKRRYTAPLMQVLSNAQSSGELRSDIPLRLLRNMLYGTMEHVLWDCIVSKREPDLVATATNITDLLWRSWTPIDPSHQSLLDFKSDVANAFRRLESRNPKQ